MNLPFVLPNTIIVQTFYQITISIAGILLPVFQAIIFFILEKSFSKFEHSRQQLVLFYRLEGKLITGSLLILILLPIFELLGFSYLSMIVLTLFIPYFFVNRTKLFYETGLWTTINSTKFIPSQYGKLKKFLRTCKNNDLSHWINYILWSSLLVIVPVILYLINSVNYSEEVVFISILINLIYVLLSISSLLNNPIEIQQQVLKSEDKLEKVELTEDKIESEKNKVLKHIKDSKIFSLTDRNSPNNRFDYFINPEIGKENEVWLYVNVSNINITSALELSEEIRSLSIQMLEEFVTWKIDINTVVLSWNLTLDKKMKNVFIRSDRDEIEKLRPIKDIKTKFGKLKNTLVDDILRS